MCHEWQIAVATRRRLCASCLQEPLPLLANPWCGAAAGTVCGEPQALRSENTGPVWLCLPLHVDMASASAWP